MEDIHVPSPSTPPLTTVTGRRILSLSGECGEGGGLWGNLTSTFHFLGHTLGFYCSSFSSLFALAQPDDPVSQHFTCKQKAKVRLAASYGLQHGGWYYGEEGDIWAGIDQHPVNFPETRWYEA